MHRLNRVEPNLPAAAYKTYQIVAPRKTHYRPATCEEVGCEAFLNGWTTILDAAQQPELVATVRTSGRPFRQHTEGTTITFIFEPGVKCFQASTHVVALEREPLYLVKGGDWRGNPAGVETVAHTSPENWRDDFAEHQDRLADRMKEG